MGCVWGGFRIEFQTMGRRRPLSRFMFRINILIWMAFTVLLEPYGSSLDCGTNPADPVPCLLNMNCNAIFGVFLSHCLSAHSG